MTQEGQGNVPKPIQDEIAAELHAAETYDDLARQHDRDAHRHLDSVARFERMARESRARAERLRTNDWQPA